MSLITVNWNPQRKQLRQFGALCVLAFAFLGAVAYSRHVLFGLPLAATTARAVAIAWFLFSATCGIAAIIAPSVLRPLYIGLSAITLPIGLVVSQVVLAVLFYGVITPLGVVMRFLGRDPMQRRFAPELPTYWQARQPVTDMRRYFRQS